MEHPILDDLDKIKSGERVIEISRSADKTPEIIPILLKACKTPKPKNLARKASWVLHHIHNIHPHLMEPYAEDLLEVLDHTEDPSVMREILKIVAVIKLTPYHKGVVREPMFELGIGLLHDEGWPKGMYYIAMRLVQRFAESKEEKTMALEAVAELISRTDSDDKPLCKASVKVAAKIKKSLARTLSVFVCAIALISCSQPDEKLVNTSVLKEVDVFVGTSEMGHVFPGATVPFGMVQLSPDTDTIPFLHEGRYTGDVYRYCSGYQYADSSIVGFSHTHFSGTGHSDLGDIRIMPTDVDGRLNPGTADNTSSGYRSSYSHENEEAHPGFYSVLLDDYNVKAELTASERVGVHKYSWENGDEVGRLIIDLDAGIYDYPGKDVWTFVRVENDTLITGYKMSSGWAKTRTVYFAMSFNKEIAEYGHKRLDAEDYKGFWRRFDQENDFPEMAGRQLVLWTDFNLEGTPLEVNVALSPTSIDGALLNIQTETAGKSFNQVREDAEQNWARELNRIELTMMSDEDVSVFRTAQYHSCLGPTLYNDVDGRYRGVDQRDHHGFDEWGSFDNYTTFSLWDTYRALHPWLNIYQPKRNLDMCRAMLAHQDQSVHGMLPIWSHYANENWCMIGYHSVSVLSDAIAKGVITEPSMAEAALDASVETASMDSFDGLGLYKEIGYVPCEKVGASVSKTLEMSYDDWCIAEIAQTLENTDIQKEFDDRKHNFRNNWDNTSGFMRPRYSDGSFREDFDVLSTHGQGFIEGNAWNYSLHVAQDVPWLIEAHGGKERFVEHLDSLFTMELPEEAIAHTEDVTRDGIIGNYVHGNEPSHHVAWMFSEAGRPDLTEYWTRNIISTMYGPGVNGLCGNDDAGQMSAWYLFASLGFYPMCPGDSKYILGSPSVVDASIDLGNGKKFRVSTENQNSENVYVQSITLNGVGLDRNYIEHNEVASGGELRFVLGPNPKAIQ